ncbi:nucleotidyl transferase AbiEii/AbiGii toxin family protein [Myxococcus sp. MISCRS1]|uniref:nucleotidyl transferase AbiEii/AbiGii toxin family protein n=1 Tax=unclassified Myxococcus TaxID=2648731 RepID=UPI001CBF5629|nr:MULTISPECIES: nucleotidyl transferase AbiEii/AbiGii toxin family protein [unclassified Myxococcus]MBZ4399233.1 nucleotidyl transferase AbiEii/AbiGii toxin family protein [Myxococcus sp. AS-1-15]MBZ4411560.1 nucleotidyl transferase AbiEii/AbiGii toxin family protein [Myxococcus sp. XM-1-1-1]MCY0999730.1 nucleotidyl transferase AbiEii/AbiGii toxin family protein [Myxococcus sp. MISCRS1]
MNFIHDDSDFDDLLRIVAKDRGLSVALVEKDYWVTHTLWALHATGFQVWFKGGTSLSKGFDLIRRFSEDLDLKLEPGTVSLPEVSSWTKDGTKVTGQRKAYFEALPTLVKIPGTSATLDLRSTDTKRWRSGNIQVSYPARHLGDLADVLRPFVLLEIGSARVTPFVHRDMTSFVHEALEARGQLGDYDDNRPKAVRCVHPLVTLLEKLDALQRKALHDEKEPASFVRHYEDAARIIEAESRLPTLPDYPSVHALASEMVAQKQIIEPPRPDAPALQLPPCKRTDDIRAAHEAIGRMFWGSRKTLDEALETIRAWLERTGLGAASPDGL